MAQVDLVLGVDPRMWDGSEWVRCGEFLGDLLDGDTAYYEIPEAEARRRWPDAFAEGTPEIVHQP